MKQFAVITLFPEMLDAVMDFGITARALDAGLIDVKTWNPRDFTEDNRRTVDDRPYGGGPGMVMMVPPLAKTIEAARNALPNDTKVIYLSPQGKRLDQAGVMQLAAEENLILLCGRYEGIDERIIESHVDEEWSIGDYVLSGGELAAMVLIDAITRTLPGALGHEDSAREDSFINGLLDYPHYTRPEEVSGQRVPDILMGGDHAKIRRWRLQQALGRTWLRRPDLLETLELDAEQSALLEEFRQSYEQGSKLKDN